MEAVVIVTVLALVQYIYFGVQVGSARAKCGIKAPAMSGDAIFERANRVHMNTLEQLIVLIPLMWIFAHYVNSLWAAGFGVVYIVGRFIYNSAYRKDPSNRSMGFTLSMLPSVVMAVWVLIVSIMAYF